MREKNLPKIRKENADKKIVFCIECYDILHSGHVRFFNNCKFYGDILVVGFGEGSITRNTTNQNSS